MNTSDDKKTYPCDVNENKAYPCDVEEAKPYPCDTKEQTYPCDEESSLQSAYDDYKAERAGISRHGFTEESSRPATGKGKRGGNAAASVVIKSGRLSERKQREERRERFRDRERPYHERGRAGAGRGEGRNDRRKNAVESVYSMRFDTMVTDLSDIGAFVKMPDDAARLFKEQGSVLAVQEKVLLPFAEQTGELKRGQRVRVSFYDDKGGRLTATMRRPILLNGQLGILKVADVTKIGAFLDNGTPKQILLPFKEQTVSLKKGADVLVWLYEDKSGRQAATMRVYSHLLRHGPYSKDDVVSGFVYEINERLGIFVAVDNKYYGLIPSGENFTQLRYGDIVSARVSKVRDDGKLDLLIRDRLYKTVDDDAALILEELKKNNGFLPYGDRSEPEFIEQKFSMSKNQFKRALGHLYKNHIVELDRENDTVRLI